MSMLRSALEENERLKERLHVLEAALSELAVMRQKIEGFDELDELDEDSFDYDEEPPR